MRRARVMVLRSGAALIVAAVLVFGCSRSDPEPTPVESLTCEATQVEFDGRYQKLCPNVKRDTESAVNRLRLSDCEQTLSKDRRSQELMARLEDCETSRLQSDDSDKKLKVTGIHPTQGDYLGGQVVEIAGNRFQADGVRSVKVYFGSVPAQVLRFQGDDRITVMAPPGKVNETVDVKFYFEPGGVITVPKAFTFVESVPVSPYDLTPTK